MRTFFLNLEAMTVLISETAVGYGLVMGVVVVAVIVYSIYKLRKQVNDAKDSEKKKNKDS